MSYRTPSDMRRRTSPLPLLRARQRRRRQVLERPRRAAARPCRRPRAPTASARRRASAGPSAARPASTPKPSTSPPHWPRPPGRCTCSATPTAARSPMQMALRWPERVARLTLYEPTRFALLLHAGQAIGAAGREILAIGHGAHDRAASGQEAAAARTVRRLLVRPRYLGGDGRRPAATAGGADAQGRRRIPGRLRRSAAARCLARARDAGAAARRRDLAGAGARHQRAARFRAAALRRA